MPESLKYVHVSIGEHHIKCVQVFGNNYAPLGRNSKSQPIVVNNIKVAICVVCGKKTYERYCLPRDF